MFADPVPEPWRRHLEARFVAIHDEIARVAESQWFAWAPPVHNYAVGASFLPLWMKYQPPWLQADLAACRALCPTTARLRDELPGVFTVCFSRLAPGARILPHRDLDEPGFLRIHMGLASDPRARLRAGEEWRTWREGHCFAFHPDVEHEVVHDGDRPRTALLVDVGAAALAAR